MLPMSRALFDTAPVVASVAPLRKRGTIARMLLRSTGTPLVPQQEARIG